MSQRDCSHFSPSSLELHHVLLNSGQNTDGPDWLSLAPTFQSQSGICQKDGDLQRP